jgi:hypothetical protein
MASGLEGFLGLGALLKPEVAAVFSAVVAGAGSVRQQGQPQQYQQWQ